jgi:hypothetical protein
VINWPKGRIHKIV